jgi:hypothetical protein
MGMVNVYFSVDTESSMAGAWKDPDRRPLKADRHIFCRIGETDYGIGLITDVLDRYGFRATHFVETLATEVNGDDDTRPVFDFLLSRGQDVQLHVHPTYHFFAESLRARAVGLKYNPPANNDLLSALPEEQQADLLGQAVTLFERFAGKRPVAFRAGCYAANRETLRCLSQLGVVLDTSFNPCFPHVSFPGESLTPNRVSRIENVWQIPVTVARTRLWEGGPGLKPADPCAISVSELRTMLETAAGGGQRHFVIVFHSFSAVKASDEKYSRIRPDRIVIRRLEKLAEYLASRPDLYRVSTFAELALEVPAALPAQAPVAELGILTAGLRKSVQGINRLYWL